MTQAANPFFQTYKTPYQTVPFDKIKTEHFEPAFEKAINEHDNEIKKIATNKAEPTFQNTIEAIEHSGQLLDRVSTVFFNLLSAESNDQMMEISQRIQPKLTEHGNNIQLNPELFARVKAIYEKKNALGLNNEQIRLLDETYDGFINNGANLNDADKEKYRELSSNLSVFTLKFGQNVLKATNSYEKVLTENQLAGLPESVREAAAAKAKQKGKEGYVVDLTAPSYGPFMKYSSNKNLRKELYMASSTRCVGGEFDNTALIDSIIDTRLAIANLLGYKTYADRVLRKRMAGNSENVYKLLNELLDAYKPSALQEYREVQGFALGMEKQPVTVMPYDWSYYSEKLKDAKFEINEELIRPYFELENVKKGVFGLATELYGITFKKNTKIQVYNPEVEAFEVFDKDGSFLSVLYTDFHPRAGKRPGAWMTEYRSQRKDKTNNIRPLVTIVMNFTRPTESKPALLSYDEVRTFLHEFGHALHGMFADTEYASMSGTSVYRDFVELPSQFMENYMNEKTYLDRFAVHYQTGEKIPAELVQKIIDASNFNVGYGCLRQLSFGFLDMACHTIEKPYQGSIAPFEYAAIAKTSVLPLVEGTLISPAFSHIFSGGYAAGYYSYKWSEVLDADAFFYFKENGIFSQDIAKSFRENVLSKGGTEDPMILYKRFRGQEPTVKALMKRNGIIKE